jgi:hypothetical protein
VIGSVVRPPAPTSATLPSCSNTLHHRKGMEKGSSTPEEDKLLIDFVQVNGSGNWHLLPKLAARTGAKRAASYSGPTTCTRTSSASLSPLRSISALSYYLVPLYIHGDMSKALDLEVRKIRFGLLI